MAGNLNSMFGTKSPLIICFINRNKLQFYSSGFGQIVAMDIPSTIINNLEVVSRDQLYVLVNQWLKQNSPGGDQLLFILSSSTYFDREIAGNDETGQETEILKFYDLVPFEELTTKVITVSNGKHVFAVNKLYLEAIQHAFYLQGLRVIGIIPVFVLGAHAVKQQLDPDMGAYVVKHAEVLLPYSVVDALESGGSASMNMPVSSAAKSNSRMMVMVSIFGVLLLILIVLLLTR